MEKTLTISMIILILISAIITGNPVVKNDELINGLAAIVGIIFCFYIIIKQKKILINKQTIAIAILSVTTTIPMIFNTHVSLSGTVYYIFRYISIFIIYTVTIHLINSNTKNKEYIKKAIIFSGIILVLFGIDLMTTGITNNFIKTIIGTKAGQQWETRMFSLFLYSNTFAISVIVAYILVLGETLKENFKMTYVGILSLLLAAILLTQSRICIILLVIGLITYFFLINKENKYKFIKVLFINSVFSLIYVMLFNYIKHTGNMILIWIITGLTILFSSLLGKILIKNERINKIIKIKTVLIIAVVGIVIFVILTFFKSPLILFNGKEAQSKVTKEILNIKPNQNYEIKVDLEAMSNTEGENYKIEFIQMNKYSDEIAREGFSVNNCNEEFTINIETKENVDLILFSIIANETNENTKVIIKSLKLNNKEFVLNYKFLPTDIINKLKNLNLSQKSVWERVTFITDGLEIIKNNFLFGIGGDGWKYEQYGVQSYYYNASQMHCYILQVFMEYGIIGGIALIVIIITTLKNIIKLIKDKKDVEISIGIAFILLLIHSSLDFDMTFLYVMFIFYLLVAMLNNKGEEYKSNNLLNNVIVMITFMVCIVSIYFSFCERYVKITKSDRLEKVNSYEEKDILQKVYIALVPYNQQYKFERSEYLNMHLNAKSEQLTEMEKENIKNEQIKLLKQSIESERGKADVIDKSIGILKIADSEEDKEFAYESIKYVFSKHKYNSNKIHDNYIKIYSLIYGDDYKYKIGYLGDDPKYKNLEIQDNYDTNKLFEIIHENLGKDILYIKDYEKCRITKEEAEEKIEEMQGVK